MTSPLRTPLSREWTFDIQRVHKNMLLHDRDIKLMVDRIESVDAYIIGAFKDFAIGPNFIVDTQTTEHVFDTIQIPATPLDWLKANLVTWIPALDFGWLSPNYTTVKTYVTNEITQTVFNVCPYDGPEQQLRLVEWLGGTPELADHPHNPPSTRTEYD